MPLRLTFTPGSPIRESHDPLGLPILLQRAGRLHPSHGTDGQDFFSAFGLGLGERTIDTIDPDGVALAAIQGVNEKLEDRLTEKDAEITELRERLERLER